MSENNIMETEIEQDSVQEVPITKAIVLYEVESDRESWSLVNPPWLSSIDKYIFHMNDRESLFLEYVINVTSVIWNWLQES